jgi:hypothetical protein
MMHAPASSFSPGEIAQFVSTVPHSGKTTINYGWALALYLVAEGDAA